MSKNLYDEAIAEAKLLKETAEQNAKNAIIEAVTPRIRQFIEDQLIGEVRDSNNDDVVDSVISGMTPASHSRDDNVILDESALQNLLTLFGSEDFSSENSVPAVRHAIRESFGSLAPGQQEKLIQAANKLNKNLVSFEGSDILNDTIEKREISRMSRNNEVLYEVDLSELSSLLRETDNNANLFNDDDLINEEVLQVDLGELDLDEEALDSLRDALSRATVTLGGEEEGEEVEVEEEEWGAEDEEGEEVEEEEGEEVEEEEVEETYEINEDILRSELLRLRRNLSEAKDLVKIKGIKNDMANQWGGSGSGRAGVKNAYGGSGSGKTGAVGSYGGGKAVGDPLKVTLNKLSEAVKNERRRNRALKERLNEYRSAVETLREQLTDLNLFNAKLLYVNKLLQNKDITNGQRRSVVEAVDGAKSLREVKLLYRSLTESFNGGTRGLTESRTRRLTGSSSRSTGRGSVGNVVAEVDRWATLAGLKE